MRREGSAVRGGRTAAAVMLWLLAIGAAIAPPLPTFVERYYAEAFYPALQPRLTALSNRAPIALLDVLAAAAVLWVALELLRSVRQSPTWPRRVVRFTIRVATAAALIYLVFLLCWGLNYRRPPAAVRFRVDRAEVTPSALRELADRTVAAVNATYDPAHRTWNDEGGLVERLGSALAAERRVHAAWTMTRGRPKRSLIARTFPWSGVDGMINPIGLEVILNPEVLPFERPFVLAHEWAHLAGHASEDEASFVGWLTCLNGDRAAQYSGWLSLYLHVVRALPPDARRAVHARLGAGPRADLHAIEVRLARAQPMLQDASWQVYDRYLRANRVPSGIASYDDVITLVLGAPAAWPHWKPRAAQVGPDHLRPVGTDSNVGPGLQPRPNRFGEAHHNPSASIVSRNTAAERCNATVS